MKTIDVSHLPPEAIEAIERLVRAFPDSPPKRRPPLPSGYLNDGVSLGHAVLEPLSDEELKLWEEGHEGDPLRSCFK